MNRFLRLIGVACVLIALVYLGGGSMLRLAQFLSITLLVLLPLAGIASVVLSRVRSLTPDVRACLACAIALVLATPLYYARRAMPFPPAYSDGVVMAALVGLSLGVGGIRRLLADLRDPSLRPAAPFVFVVLPILMCLVWAGFEVRTPTGLRYYGLTPVDYSNLANVGALVKISPGLPLDATAGLQPVGYHWYFFALPAWASEVFGTDTRVAEMLVLFDALSAAVLIATVVVVLPRVSRAAMIIAIAVALFAPLSTYAYQFAMKMLHLSIGDRNSLVLSPVNSMTTFGNNTLAIAIALLICQLVLLWNDRRAWSIAALIALLATAMMGYSVTLAMPLALAIGVWILSGRVRSPFKLVGMSLPFAVAGLFVLVKTQVLGASGEAPSISFDNFQFLRNVILGIAPIVVLLTIGLVATRELSLYAMLALACVVVPTVVGLSGSRSGESALSMKIASLLAVAAAPLAAHGAQFLIDRKHTLLRVFAVLVCLAGVANTAAYVFQFAAARTIGRGSRFVELPHDYVDALRIARQVTPRHAIVIDSEHLSMPQTISTQLLAERRVWLLTSYTIESHQFATSDRRKERVDEFVAWRGQGLRDVATARYLAAAADVLIVRQSDGEPPAPWQLHAKTGEYAVYLSQLRSR